MTSTKYSNLSCNLYISNICIIGFLQKCKWSFLDLKKKIIEIFLVFIIYYNKTVFKNKLF